MGIKDMLFGRGATKEERTLDKLRNRLLNAHRQTEDRRYIVGQLFEIGSEGAVEVLLARFTYRVESSINDEEEKSLVVEALADMGEVAMEPLEAYVRKKAGVYWPLKAYRAIAGDEAALDLLLAALDTIDEGYAEEERRKAELISNLREFTSDRALGQLRAALGDENDDVRVMAAEGMIAYGPDRALPGLVDRLIDPEERPRIRIAILEIIADAGWKLKKHRAALAGNLPPGYDLSDDGEILRA